MSRKGMFNILEHVIFIVAAGLMIIVLLTRMLPVIFHSTAEKFWKASAFVVGDEIMLLTGLLGSVPGNASMEYHATGDLKDVRLDMEIFGRAVKVVEFYRVDENKISEAEFELVQQVDKALIKDVNKLMILKDGSEMRIERIY